MIMALVNAIVHVPTIAMNMGRAEIVKMVEKKAVRVFVLTHVTKVATPMVRASKLRSA